MCVCVCVCVRVRVCVCVYEVYSLNNKNLKVKQERQIFLEYFP